jgi:AraC-like DNA-binding protein
MAAISLEDHLEQRSLVHLAASLADATAPHRKFELEERLVRHVGRLLAGSGVGHPRPARRVRTARRHERVVERAREFLASDLERPVRLEQVAAATDVSPFHLAHVFRALTGMPMHDYRDQLRLRAALPWVLSGARPLTEVALEIGYASPSHFTDRFRAAYGMPPTTLRRRLTAGWGSEPSKITEAHPHRPS